MSIALIIMLPSAKASPDTPISWCLSDGQCVLEEGQFEPGSGPVWQDDYTPEYTIALMPSEDVFITRLTVPGQNNRQARQAAPFLIEDQLATSLEASSVHISDKADDGQRWIWALSQDLFEHWKNLLAPVTIRPVYAVPDCLVLPLQGGDLTISRQEDRLLFKTRMAEPNASLSDMESSSHVDNGPITGCIASEHGDHILPALGEALKPNRLILSEGLDPAPLFADGQTAAIQRLPDDDLRLMAASTSLEDMSTMPSVFEEAGVSSLNWMALINPWKRTAVLACIAFLVSAVFLGGQGFYYSSQTQVYLDAADDLILETIPGITRRPLAQREFQQRLNQLGLGDQGPGFLELASRLANVMNPESPLQIESIRYDAERASLSVTAYYNDFADFEAFRDQAETQGLVIEDGGARQENAGFVGEFLVRAAS